MQTRYVIGAGVILGAFAVIAIVAYFANQQLYMSVDELLANPALYSQGAASGEGVSMAYAQADDEAEGGGMEGSASAGLSSARRFAGPRIQVRGNVDYGTVERPDSGLEMRFDLVGETGRIPVVYEGMVPDTFDMAEAVTVAGHVAPDGTFVADDLAVQCPSKYEAAPPGSTQASSDG
jgi:hypothetical protein